MLRSREAPKPAELADELAQATEGAPHLLLSVLMSREVPALGPDTESQVLNVFQEELALRSLALLDHAAIRNSLSGHLHDTDAVRPRRAGIQVLGAIGDEDDVEQVLELALREGEEAVHRRLEEALRGAVGALALREPKTVFVLLGELPDLPDELLDPVLSGVGDARVPEGLELVLDVLLSRPEHALLAMAQVRMIGPAASETLGSRLSSELLKVIDFGSVQERQAAVLALAALEDRESMPVLIDLLEDPAVGIREGAHFGLKRVSGEVFPPLPDLWSTWLAEQLQWYQSERPAALAGLRAIDVPEVAEAMRALSGRRLFRHELAEAVSSVFDHPHPSVRTIACDTLAELRSPHALPALLQALNDRAPEVRERARLALLATPGGESALTERE
jgi:HEAT repeat protein